MDKRYQVFVSSTYEDLQKERQAVIQSLLEFDCIPVGMEFFPAADDTAWEVIKRVIEECDYYVVIVAGRYGSLSKEGISYTQKEYEYAVECRVPVMAFLHGDPGKIPSEKTEGTEEAREKLEEFRNICQERLCRYWKTPDELAGAVVKSLNQLKKTQPRTGWVRADQVADEAATKEILKLRNQIEELEQERQELRTKPPADTEDLAQGDDEIEIPFTYRYNISDGTRDDKFSISLSWNRIFGYIAPFMLEWVADHTITHQINTLIESASTSELDEHFPKHMSRLDFKVDPDVVNTIKIQLRALGLIERQEGAFAWRITSYGDKVMTQLKAIKRPNKS